jgi:hypothetical protein
MNPNSRSKTVRPPSSLTVGPGSVGGTQRPSSGSIPVRPTSVSGEALKREAIERAKQLAALQEQIAAAQKSLQLSNQLGSVRPPIQQQQQQQRSTSTTPYISNKKEHAVEGRGKTETVNPYWDTSQKSEINVRRPRALHFIEKGKFEAEAQQLRAKEQLEKLQKQIAESARKAGMESVVDIDISILQETIPEVEWWDSVILKAPSYDDLDTMAKYETITHYVQHPVPIKSQTGGTISSPTIPVMLTSTETKKLRRQRRLALEKEKQDKIRMGLMPPPEPKGEPFHTMNGPEESTVKKGHRLIVIMLFSKTLKFHEGSR